MKKREFLTLTPDNNNPGKRTNQKVGHWYWRRKDLKLPRGRISKQEEQINRTFPALLRNCVCVTRMTVVVFRTVNSWCRALPLERLPSRYGRPTSAKSCDKPTFHSTENDKGIARQFPLFITSASRIKSIMCLTAQNRHVSIDCCKVFQYTTQKVYKVRRYFFFLFLPYTPVLDGRTHECNAFIEPALHF